MTQESGGGPVLVHTEPSPVLVLAAGEILVLYSPGLSEESVW